MLPVIVNVVAAEVAVGVPLIVMVLDAHDAVTPAGNPVGEPMPVAPVVAIVIAVKAVLIHKVGLEDGLPAVFAAVTTIVPVAFTPNPMIVPQAQQQEPASQGILSVEKKTEEKDEEIEGDTNSKKKIIVNLS